MALVVLMEQVGKMAVAEPRAKAEQVEKAERREPMVVVVQVPKAVQVELRAKMERRV
jgi:hypothetical protein